MSTPTFQIVTVDNQAHTQGRPAPIQFTGLVTEAASKPRVESFVYDGDYVELRYTGGFTVRIPEHRIAYIVEYRRAS